MKNANSSSESFKAMEFKDLKENCSRIREKIIDYTAENGGYLASNLSNVEISVALHRVFDEQTEIQYAADDLNYTDLFLHEENPVSAKSNGRKDVLSECLGIACARMFKNEQKETIAVISKKDLLSSKGLEALQMIQASKNKIIIVFNDMRSSKSIKAVDKLVSRLRNTKAYTNLKENVKEAIRPVKYGEQIIENIHDFKDKVKKVIINEGIFAQYDIDYVGPVNGHDLKDLERAFQIAKEKKNSVVVHCVTIYGKGYEIAERDLNHRFFRIGPFNRNNGRLLHCENENYRFASGILSEFIGKKMAEEKKLCCVISDDQAGRGVSELFAKYPERCFMTQTDIVSTVSFAAGILKEGYGVYLPIRSSELAEAYPALCKLKGKYEKPFIVSLVKDIAVDYDLLKNLSGLFLCEPKDASTISQSVQTAISSAHATVFLLPDECIDVSVSEDNGKTEKEKWQKVIEDDKNRTAILAYGTSINIIRSIIVNNQLSCDLYDMLYLKPIDDECLERIFEKHRQVFILGRQYREGILDYKDKLTIETKTVFIENEDVSELFRRIKEVLDA